jgi:hypothetical protein
MLLHQARCGWALPSKCSVLWADVSSPLSTASLQESAAFALVSQPSIPPPPPVPALWASASSVSGPHMVWGRRGRSLSRTDGWQSCSPSSRWQNKGALASTGGWCLRAAMGRLHAQHPGYKGSCVSLHTVFESPAVQVSRTEDGSVRCRTTRQWAGDWSRWGQGCCSLFASAMPCSG